MPKKISNWLQIQTCQKQTVFVGCTIFCPKMNAIGNFNVRGELLSFENQNNSSGKVQNLQSNLLLSLILMIACSLHIQIWVAVN